jgi:ABC-type sugar transport system ATPase subunit
MIFVTHDHADAMTVGDELAVLIDGRIVDRGEPQRVFDAPATAAVATFLGTRPMNLLPSELFGEAADAVVGIRPERLHFAPDGPLCGIVVRVERTGADAYVNVICERTKILVRVAAADAPAAGAAVGIAYDPTALRHFDRTTGVARA